MPRIQNISKAGRSARGIGRFAKGEIKDVTDEQAKTFVDGSNFALVDEAVPDAQSSQDAEDTPAEPMISDLGSTPARSRRSKSPSNA